MPKECASESEKSPKLGDRKSLSIAKNHPKTSQEFSEQFGPSTHKLKGFGKNSHQKVHPNFAKTWEDKFLGIPFLAPKNAASGSFWTLFGLQGALFGLPRAGGRGTPFRTLLGLFWGSGREGPGRPLCQAGGFAKQG